MQWRERIVRRFGPGVAPWIEALPARAAALAGAWGLELGAPFATGSTSRVIACRDASGAPAVLKLAPEPALIAAEAAALDAWADTGRVPRVLARTGDALLLERIEPGLRLVERAQPATIAEVAALTRALRVAPPPGHAFPPLRSRIRFVYALAAARAADPSVVERAARTADALAAEPYAAPVLVHGDLHAGNVLTGPPARPLVAIDPRPCVGDPALDLVDWVMQDGDPVERAHALAAATGYDPDRLLRWTAATAVLAGPAALSRPGAGERYRTLPRPPD
jgi:streptomycin 6-kinase